MNQRRRKHSLPQSLITGLQVPGQNIDLVPQRLRIDRQPLTIHDPHLTLQRQVIEVLAGRHLHRKLRRISPSGDQLARARGRHHGRVATAAVLLAPVAHDNEAPLDDRHLLGVFALIAHFLELTATLRALALLGWQLVQTLDQGQLWLRTRAMAALRGRLAGRLRGLMRTLLRRVAEQSLLALRQKLLQLRELQLQRRRVGAAEAADLALERLDALTEGLILSKEQEGNLSQDLDILLLLDLNHATKLA